jgi:hypothetical protein
MNYFKSPFIPDENMNFSIGETVTVLKNPFFKSLAGRSAKIADLGGMPGLFVIKTDNGRKVTIHKKWLRK